VALIRSTISAGSRRRNGGTGIGSGMGTRLLDCGADVRKSRAARMRIRTVPQTPWGDPFTLVFVLRAPRGFDRATVDAIEDLLRPLDEDLRVWRYDADGTVVWGSVECTADELDGALARGRGERQLVWRCEAPGPG
jgi:hypothetical protein